MALKTRKVERIELAGDFCLYEAAAAPTLEKIRAVASAIASQELEVDGVLLIQNGPSDDYSQSWQQELERELLAEQLSDRILAVRKLLSTIRHSPVPWVFASNERTLGSHWELALACRERYIFGEHCSLGMPEIKVGVFPPGGIVENIGRKRTRTRDRLQAVPVADPQYALKHNIIQFAGDSTDFAAHAEMLFLRRLAEAATKLAAQDAIPTDAPTQTKPRHEIFAELTQRLPAFQTGRVRQASAWELCWTLVRDYNPQTGMKIGAEIAALASQFFLSTRYKTWLSKRVALRTRSTKRNPLLRTVTIDLDHLAPPSAVLNRLIHLNTNLVFVAEDPRALQTSLDLVYTRLEKDAAWQELARYWKGHVSWYVGSCNEEQGSYMRFLIDDRVLISCEGSKAEIVRLSGNERHAVRGACEWPIGNETASDLLESAISLTANRLVRTHPLGPDRMPISMWIRSLCLEELIRVSDHFQNDLMAVVDHLGTQGWEFAGRVEAWDRFLRTRSLNHPLRHETVELYAEALDQTIWEVGLFKHVRAAAKRRARPDARPWNPAELSIHMALFVGLLTLIIKDKGWCHHPDEAEILCMESLGLPESFGSPVSYLHRRGRRRVSYYLERNWSAVDPALLWRYA